MAAISVRDLDDEVTAKLKVRAARHGRSMEAEVRAILTDAALEPEDEPVNLAQAIRQRFAEVEGADVPMPARTDSPRAADLSNLT
jgi:plasmid stability protein